MKNRMFNKKKILALILSLTMVIGQGYFVFAAEDISIIGIDDGFYLNELSAFQSYDGLDAWQTEAAGAFDLAQFASESIGTGEYTEEPSTFSIPANAEQENPLTENYIDNENINSENNSENIENNQSENAASESNIPDNSESENEETDSGISESPASDDNTSSAESTPEDKTTPDTDEKSESDGEASPGKAIDENTNAPEAIQTPQAPETEPSDEPQIEVVNTLIEENTEDLFPGLPDEYVLSTDEMEEKEAVAEHIAELATASEGEDYIENEILVSAETRAQAREYAKAFGGRLKDYDYGLATITLNADTGNTGSIDDAAYASVEDAVCASADENSNLPAAWPNYLGEYNDITTFNDPFLTDKTDYQWHHEAIGSEYAWRLGYTGKGVKVAVLDSGLLPDHNDIKGTVIGDSVYGDNYGDGHGTHVAGIIGATANNNLLGCGIAPDSDILIYCITDLNKKVPTDELAIKGIRAAIEEGADVINMSWGTPSYSGLLDDAITEAYNKGIAVFCAAGNESTNSEQYPASYAHSVSVAALDQGSSRAYFSNYSGNVRYAAPGMDILSTYNSGSSGYTRMNGTSQAAPVAAGVAAVILSSGQIKSAKGAGRVEELLQKMDEGCIALSGKGLGKGRVSLAKIFEPDVPSQPKFYVDDKEISSSVSFDKTSETVSIKSVNPGCRIFYTLNKPLSYSKGVTNGALYSDTSKVTVDGASKVTLQAVAVNSDGVAGSIASVTINLNSVGSKVSKIDIKGPGNAASLQLVRGKSVQLKTVIKPSDAIDKSVTWSVEPAGQGVNVNSSGLVTTKKSASGSYTVTATSSDGGNVTGSFDISVSSGKAISKIKLSKTTAKLCRESGRNDAVTQIELTVKTTPSSDRWEAISSDENVVTVSKVSSKKILIQATGNTIGTANVTVYATDGSGKKAKCKVTVINPISKIFISTASNRSHRVAKGKTVTLVPTFETAYGPIAKDSKKLKWTSSNPKVATVNQKGVVTAKKASGQKVTITAKSKDGSNVSQSFTIVTTAAITSMYLYNPLTRRKMSSKFNFNTTDGNAANLSLSLRANGNTISGDYKVTVDSPGLSVKAMSADSFMFVGNKAGKYKVTIKCNDGSGIKKSYTVTVK